MSNQLKFISEPQTVSMADEWFEFNSPDHFWMEQRLRTLLKHSDLLPADGEKIFDIGCGNGMFLRQLLEHRNLQGTGCDLNLAALQLADVPGAELYVYDILRREPTLAGAYAAAFLMDVIEHIDDDREFLNAAAFHVRPGGSVIINVPCGQKLYSAYDRAAGHRRRYSPEDLRRVIEAGGLNCLRIVSWGFLLLPIILLRNLAVKFAEERNVIATGFKPPMPIVNSALKAVSRLELALPFSPPCGTSLLAFARKPG